MDGLHNSLHLTGNLIAYSTALLIATMLLVLTLRTAGVSLANVGFAVCAVLWTGGGLAQVVLQAAGFDTFIPRAVQFSAGLGVVVPVLAAWGARRVAQAAGVVSGAFALLVWSQAVPLATLRLWIAYYATAALLLGFATVAGRMLHAGRSILLPSLTIVVAALAAVVLATVRVSGGVYFLLSHLILLAVLCGFFLFARFTYADTFVRYSVRILLAGTIAASLLQLTEARVLAHLTQRHDSMTVHVFAMVLLANIVLISLTFLDEAISRRVIRWLFRTPDYAAEARNLEALLGPVQDESEIYAVLEAAVRRSLGLPFADVEPPGGSLPVHRGELVVPIYAGGELRRNLRIHPGPNRPALVSQDLLYLRDLAAVAGHRLDALAREREAAERQSREATLLQQVTEAELRALRAQINPHFLFNSLNTIADLTVRDPARAETMTVRLAAVFRHVLAHSARPLTTVRDELEFLRTYLYIEEVRFGERLQVSIEASREVESAAIPSLILQPLVENALKHGLGPKPGHGHLWIRAALDGGDVRLTVEDDGEGLRPPREPRGVGLANIAERLRTLYRDRASVTLEAREGGGARATVRIPRDAA